MATLNISLPQQMRDWIDQQVASGTYANASDYMRDLVRKHRQREKEHLEYLRAEIKKGEDSGFCEDTIPDIIREAKQRLKEKNG